MVSPPAEDSSCVDIHGGRIDALLRSGFSYPWIYDIGAVITLFGGNVSVDGVPVPFGANARDYASEALYPDYNGRWHSRYYGSLAGVLSDGSPIDTDFEIYQGASILFAVPEPSATVLTAFAGFGLLRRRRRHRHGRRRPGRQLRKG